MAESDQQVAANPATAYEPSDLPLRPVGWVYAICLVFLVLVVGVTMLAYPNSLGDVSRRITVEPPSPRLQINPAADLAQLRAEKEKKLNGYYWIDKQGGVVHIPIDSAMQKLVKSGIDGFPKAQP